MAGRRPKRVVGTERHRQIVVMTSILVQLGALAGVFVVVTRSVMRMACLVQHEEPRLDWSQLADQPDGKWTGCRRLVRYQAFLAHVSY